MNMELHYTAHYNWQWVITAAHEQLLRENPTKVSSIHDCKSFRMLPSVKDSAIKQKAEYSLIRVDILPSPSNSLSATIPRKYKIRFTSQGFADLDPKDALFRRLIDYGAVDCMPTSILIPWNAAESDIPATFTQSPSLLKAPMGSGGFGLYYVYHPRDIYPILRNHRLRAEREPKFMSNLLQSYKGAQPSWSLQEVIASVKGTVPSPDGNSTEVAKRRTQIRVYVVLCEDRMYLYENIEVRMPLWDCDIDAVLAEETALYSSSSVSADSIKDKEDSGYQRSSHIRRPWSDIVEEECCGEGNARPYNEQRNKKETCRFMLEEIPELEAAREQILHLTKRAFQAIAPSIFYQHNYDDTKHHSTNDTDTVSSSHAGGNSNHHALRERDPTEVQMAIVGVDLLATLSDSQQEDKYRVVMVEVNNNPAIPGINKQMSPAYRQHLIQMVADVIQLGLAAAADGHHHSNDNDQNHERQDSFVIPKLFQLIA